MSGVAKAFVSDAEIERIGEGLIARTLPGAEWTHAAHWAAAMWLIVKRPDLHPPRDMPAHATLSAICNTLLASELGRPDWLLRYWSKPVLFPVEARRGWVESDLLPLPYPHYPV